MKTLILYLLLMNKAFALDAFNLDSEKTLYIVDGDSISMQMRIAGIDTPEIKQPCEKTPQQIMDCGRLSKAHLRQLLKTTPGKLRIIPVAADHYHRILVRIYKGDTNIGKRMVEQGMAYSYKDTYKKQQQYAKANKLGFWSFHQPPIQPYKWRKLNPR